MQHQHTALRDEVKQIVAQSGIIGDVQRRLYRWLYCFRNVKSSRNSLQCQQVDSLEGGVGPRDQHIEIKREAKHDEEVKGHQDAVDLIKANWDLEIGTGKNVIGYDTVHGQGMFVKYNMPCAQWVV